MTMHVYCIGKCSFRFQNLKEFLGFTNFLLIICYQANYTSVLIYSINMIKAQYTVKCFFLSAILKKNYKSSPEKGGHLLRDIFLATKWYSH